MEVTTEPGVSSRKKVVERAAGGVHQTVDKIVGAAVPLINRLAESAHQAVDKITDTTTPAAQWLETSAHRLNESRIKLLDDTKQTVREHPYAALGTAMAIGVLLGYMARRH